jgi:hypothetical protein
MVVRSIGSDLHMDYTAVGQTTHLAARMEQLAKPGSILITPEVLRLVEGYVEVTPLGSVAVKGLHAPVDVYEVVWAGPARSRLQAAARGLTRFVGGDREVDHLAQVLEWAGRGHGQVVALVGEPEVGKSHLVEECLHAPRAPGWGVWESRAFSYGRAIPYLPVIDLEAVGFFEQALSALPQRPESHEMRGRMPMCTGNGATRRMPCAFSARSPRIGLPQRSSRPHITIGRPSP